MILSIILWIAIITFNNEANGNIRIPAITLTIAILPNITTQFACGADDAGETKPKRTCSIEPMMVLASDGNSCLECAESNPYNETLSHCEPCLMEHL
ncbi:hypothetical protein TNIN_15401, partial [Trichonephila inaurata madagascariensis]